jgi:hypothetical protein
VVNASNAATTVLNPATAAVGCDTLEAGGIVDGGRCPTTYSARRAMIAEKTPLRGTDTASAT